MKRKKWYASGAGIARTGPYGTEAEARESMRLAGESEAAHRRHIHQVAVANAMLEARYHRELQRGFIIPAHRPRAREMGGYPPDLKVWSE